MEIHPALTPAEWAEFLAEATADAMDEAGRAMRADRALRTTIDAAVTTRRYHAAGALALHGQGFGFTWDDVDRLRALAGDAEPWAAGLAERIAALLPPRG